MPTAIYHPEWMAAVSGKLRAGTNPELSSSAAWLEPPIRLSPVHSQSVLRLLARHLEQPGASLGDFKLLESP